MCSNTLTHPLREIENTSSITGGQLLLTDPLEGFALRIKISAYVGIALAMPVILWQLWRFVSPGLYPNERRYAVAFVVSAIVLFVIGRGDRVLDAAQGAQFLAAGRRRQLRLRYTGQKYFTLIVYMMLAFGVGFEFPILLVFLQLVGDRRQPSSCGSSGATPSSSSSWSPR